jgi:thiosulfate dehydrogenase
MKRTSWIALGMWAGGCTSPPPPPPPPAQPPAQAATVFRVPSDSEIPADQVGASIKRGRAILDHTRDSLPAMVGNNLRCTSCHLDLGTRPNAAPWVGVYSRFPQYRSRNAKVNVIEDRINDCFQRSLAGKPLALGSRDLTDIIAYMAFLSRGVAPPGDVPGQGFQKMDPLVPDTIAGRLGYVAQCARCHGAEGEGMANPDPSGTPGYYPPLWGPRSYTVGAGMARLRTAASFIRANMPFDKPGSLTDREAFDVAGYLVSRSRPDFAGKEHDWPNGDPPPDVAYKTNAAPSPKEKR